MTDTFCILPYIHHHIDVKGRNRLCCYASPNEQLTEFGNKEYVKIRKQMADGQKINQCMKCWNLEEKGQISHRQMSNAKWKHITPNILNTQVLTADYRLTNHCNFACVFCGPHNSSKWSNINNVDTIVHKNEIAIDNSKLQYVYLAGGEPLLVPEFKNFVKAISNKDKTEIVINTNLSRIDNEWIEILQQFKSKCLTVSVDAYGEICEYIRWPLNWQKFEDNCKIVSENDIPIMFNTVMCNLNYFDLDQLLDWMQQYNPVSIGMSSCINPKELNLDILKMNDRHMFIEITKKLLQHPVVKNSVLVQKFLLSQIDNVDVYNKDTKLSNIIDFLYDQDIKKGISINSVDCTFTRMFIK